jgi:hypothetical protein
MSSAYTPRHPLRLGAGPAPGLRVVGRIRVTILSNGQAQFEAKRTAGLDKSLMIKTLRALSAKMEREEDSSLLGPTGETLVTEARLGDMG